MENNLAPQFFQISRINLSPYELMFAEAFACDASDRELAVPDANEIALKAAGKEFIPMK